jgi:hypothetical protein
VMSVLPAEHRIMSKACVYSVVRNSNPGLKSADLFAAPAGRFYTYIRLVCCNRLSLLVSSVGSKLLLRPLYQVILMNRKVGLRPNFCISHRVVKQCINQSNVQRVETR